MLIRALSDQHGHLPPVESCDLLVIAGDFCPVEDHSLAYQDNWLRGPFRDYLWSLLDGGVGQIVGVAGNHDFVFMEPSLAADLPWTYLQDREMTIGGLRIYGSPWVPQFGGWAFEARPKQLKAVFSLIPQGIDLLVTHSPPYGYGDAVPRFDHRGWEREREERLGSKELLAAVDRVQPQLHVFGHVHEGHGQWRRGNTRMANVTLLDERYSLRFEPAAFDLEPR